MHRITILVGLLVVTACAPAPSTGGDGNRIADRFTQSDANGDGFISRSEAPSRLDFDAADTDADGLLSMAEIETFTRSMRR